MDLRQILQQAGFSGSNLDTAYAVAMAESSGNAGAYNGNAGTGDKSYGLFQINMLGAMGPERRAQYGLSSNDALFDPLTNAKVAYKLSQGGTNWSPWSTYKNGSYLQYKGQAPSGGVGGGTASGTTDAPAQQAPQVPADITNAATGLDFAPSTQDFAPGQQDFAQPVPQQAPAPPELKYITKYSDGSSSFRDKVISAAMGFLGTAYSWGGGTTHGTSYGVAGAKYNGTNINGLDCSGLMLAAFGLSGYNLPRIAKQQLATGQTAKLSSLQPGDLIGYGDGYHVALYLGDGKLIDSLPGFGVTVRNIGAWERREAWGVHLNLPGD